MMKTGKKFGQLVWLTVMLVNCSTYYGPRNMKGGYCEQQIDDQTVQVIFVGNQQSTVDEVRTLLTFRCSEVTVNQGYNYFMIIKDNSFDQNARKDYAESHIKVQSRTSMSGGTHTNVTNSFTTEATNSNLVGIYTIRMLEDPDPIYPVACIDARAFIEANKAMIPR